MSRARFRTVLGLLCFVWFGACAGRPVGPQPVQEAQAAPPKAPARPHRVHSPHGDRSDEYYWLRDDSRRSPEVLAYLNAENAYADAALAPLSGTRRALYEEMVARIAPEDDSVPVQKRGYWYWTRYVPGGEYPVYVRRAVAEGAREEILLDENQLAQGSGYYHVGAREVSADGTLLAWAEDRVGRGQYTLRIKRLDRAEILPDTLQNVETSLAWANDHKTLLYIEKDPVTLLGTRVRRHVLGTDPRQDPVVYEERDHSFYLSLWKSRSDRFVYLYAHATDSTEQWAASADDPALAFQCLLPRAPGHEYLAEDSGDGFIVRSNQGAPNFRLVRAVGTPLSPAEQWQVLVPEPAAGLIEDFAVFRDFIAYVARSRGQLGAYVLSATDGKAREVALPGAAFTVRLGENPEVEAGSVRFEYTSLTVPDSVYDYAFASGALTLQKRQPVLGDFEPEAYVSQQLAAPARDGASIPLSLAQHTRVARDGTAPLYLLGYGAYGASDDPEFSSARLSLLKRGVVVAIAHVRGGQELGRAWYERGRKAHKQNTFRDFIDATDFLTQRGYASAQRVAARGASAGGLLIGAVANLAPEKYRVLVAHVPFVDVVTTMLDESIPLTSNEYDEWGDPRRAADYATMLAYSPYDNVKARAYPALYVSTSLWDSQVQYYEPAKWVARLRARKIDRHPLLFRVHMQASHGGRSGRFARLEQLAEEYAFVLDQLGVREPATPPSAPARP